MRGPRSPLLHVYAWIGAMAEPFGSWFLKRRLNAGKEDRARIDERLGRSMAPRPPGPLIWLHGASVGEALSLLPLIGLLRGRGLGVLLTTGTLSSAKTAATRLPHGAIHQFIPLDLPQATRRFLDHWRPACVFFAESELWPTLMMGVLERDIPLAIVNGRLSERSFRRWQSMGGALRPILSRLAFCFAQSKADAVRYASLGAAHVSTVGNLKFDASPLPFDPEMLGTLKESIGLRPLWLVASSHSGEDSIALAAHGMLAKHHPGLLTIVVPRHPDRAPSILSKALDAGLFAALRSKAEIVPPGCALYIADTLGELGLFYRACSIALIGGSLARPGGGHNPIEPAQLGCAILSGPLTHNFNESYEMLRSANALITISDAASLAAAVDGLLRDPKRTVALGKQAAQSIADTGGVSLRIMTMIEAVLPIADTARPCL